MFLQLNRERHGSRSRAGEPGKALERPLACVPGIVAEADPALPSYDAANRSPWATPAERVPIMAPPAATPVWAGRLPVRANTPALILEDNLDLAELIEEELREHACDCHVTVAAEEAMRLLDRVSFDLAVVDIFMRGVGGLAAIEDLRARCPDCKVLAISGCGKWTTPGDILQVARQAGAHATLPKPFELAQLGAVVEMLLHPAS